jgi:hypothetical protein
MKKSILDRLKQGIVLGDGGYLLALESRGYVQAGPFTPEVTIDHPNALRALHEEFVHAGAEVLQVLGFYASENKLAQIGYANRLAEINRAAVRIAREAAQTGNDILVAGDLCLTWKYQEGNQASFDECRRLFEAQIEFQRSEGVDFWICETFLHVGEALITLEAAKKTRLPVMVTLAFRRAEDPRWVVAGRSREAAGRRRHGHRGHQLLDGPQAHVAGRRRSAESREGLPRRAAGGVPLHRRSPILHGPERLSGSARSLPADPHRDGRLRRARQGPRRQLHRRMLRLPGSSHPADGPRARQEAVLDRFVVHTFHGSLIRRDRPASFCLNNEADVVNEASEHRGI